MNRVIKADRVSTIKPGEQTLDVKLVAVKTVITTENRDRSQDIVVTAGIDLTNHERNPVVLLEHEYPIGVARSPDGLYTVEKHHGFATATTYFDQGNPLAVEAFRMIDDGILKGASIGFVVKRASVILAEPGTVQINIDHEGDRVTKEKFGIRYDEVELVEYTHTILPDNPDALTVAVQKGRMSAVMKRLLSPHVLETPASVSVPAEIETITVEKTVADEQKPDTDETPKQDGYVTEDETKTEQPQAEQAVTTDDLPPGARLLDGVYLRLLELASYLEAEGGNKRQENPDVLAFVEQFVPQLDEMCASISDTYDGLYPDLDSLDKSDGPEAETPEDDEPEPEPEGKRVRKRLADRIEAYRKSRVGLKPVEVAAKPDAISKEEYDALQKRFDKLETGYTKLLKQFRAARAGR